MQSVYRAAGLAFVLASPCALGMGILPNCLDDLSATTRTWNECVHRFGRNETQCKQPTADMWSDMQRCERKGYSKREIDAAMAEGAHNAGKGGTNKVPLPERPPAPQPKQGPIPGIAAPRTGGS